MKSDLIHTGLQPGDLADGMNMKPFKRFPHVFVGRQHQAEAW